MLFFLAQKQGEVFITHHMLYSLNKKNEWRIWKMKGYTTDNGYMGYVNGGYQLFASESDYKEWMEA